MANKIYYRAVGNEVEVFDKAYAQRLPLLLKGPTGCGKSRFIEAMAERVGRPLVTITCNEETSSTDLLGRYLVQGQETVWQDGPATRAVRTGAILYLDEVAEAREDVITVLHPLTDYRRRLFVDRHDEEIVAGDSFMLVVSFNPGYQRSLRELKPSTRQRFVSMAFHYPAREVESEIVAVEAGIDGKLADKLVALGHKIRNLQEAGLRETVSTRLLIGAGKLIRAGLPERSACEVGIIHSLTDDNEIAAGLRDLVSLAF